MLELNNISLSIGKKHLLENATVRIERGYRVGLYGRNGAGKSSLIKMVLGQLQEDSGSIQCELSGDAIAHLQQELPKTSLQALDYAKRGDKDWACITDDLERAEQLEDGVLIAECHAKLAQIDGYAIDARAAKILKGLGFSAEQMLLPVSSLSGGWQMRLQLAHVLLSRSALMFLDEPTNHLDIDAIVWLEQWLLQCDSTIIVISHDRDFLDSVCTHTMHLSQLRLKLYKGNYTAFSKQYSVQLEIESKQAQKFAAKKAHLQSFVDRFKAKASKAKQAQSRVKALEKMSLASGLIEESPFQFSFFSVNSISGTLVSFLGEAGYGTKVVLGACHLEIKYGDRVGVIGKNGEGKSTLLKTLVRDLPLVSGTLSHHAKNTIGYFSQQQLDMLDLQSSPLQSLVRLNAATHESDARNYLAGFDFVGDRVFECVEKFSGGERARLALALLIYQQPNLLVLDEPTNHLDMQMREALICALQNFNGGVILVSHDRYFMESVVDELWCVSNGKVDIFRGNLEEYKNIILNQEGDVYGLRSEGAPGSAPLSTVVTKKNDYADRKKIKKLEQKISRLEESVKHLEERLTDPVLYTDERKADLHDLIMRHKNERDKLELLEEQWLNAQK